MGAVSARIGRGRHVTHLVDDRFAQRLAVVELGDVEENPPPPTLTLPLRPTWNTAI
jgi:hypothetical protein